MKTLLIRIAVLIPLVPGLAPFARAECEGLLPEPTGARPSDECTYVHVPFSTFTFDRGLVRATWSERWEILEARLVADWTVVAEYRPGLAIRLAIDEDRSRYDFVSRVRDAETGEVFHAVTPIWCYSLPHAFPAPTSGCFGSEGPLGCSVSADETCPDGSRIRVTCTGDNGTCKEGNKKQDGRTCVTCKSSSTTTQNHGTTELTLTLLTSKRQCCPELPDASP